MFLNRSQIAAAVTGLILVVGAGSGSQIAFAGNAQTNKMAATQKERHPELRAALRELTQARNDIQNGARDFKGDRVKALNDINEAIAEVQKALKADLH